MDLLAVPKVPLINFKPSFHGLYRFARVFIDPLDHLHGILHIVQLPIGVQLPLERYANRKYWDTNELYRQKNSLTALIRTSSRGFLYPGDNQRPRSRSFFTATTKDRFMFPLQNQARYGYARQPELPRCQRSNEAGLMAEHECGKTGSFALRRDQAEHLCRRFRG
jgi:hypothetical protein